MAVAVQAQLLHFTRTFKAALDAFQRLLNHAAVSLGNVRGYPMMVAQKMPRLDAEAFDIQSRAMFKRLDRAQCMNAPDKTSHPFQGLGFVKFRHAPAAPRV